MVINQLQEDH